MKDLTTLYPFKNNYLDLGSARLHYLDEGKGEPVVMLHGNPSWSFMYRDLVKALSADYRCIVPDHVGMGMSDKPARYNYTLDQRVADLDRLLDSLSIKEGITLIVHDWGGMIGMAWAVRHPERVKRIVLMNTAAFFPPASKGLPWQVSIVRDTPLGPILVQGFNAFAAGAAKYCCTRRPMSREVQEGYTAPYDSWANRVATLRFVQDIPLHPKDKAYATVAVTEQCLEEKLAGIPMLIVWGGKDFVFDMDFLREWRRRFPGADLCSIPEAGHYVLEDAPDIAIPEIQRFLKKNPLPYPSPKGEGA